jgi:hypothetical protein
VQRWPQVRAGLIALAIALGLVDGCPLPRPGHVPEWQQGFVEPIRRVQQAVLTPVAPIGDRLRVSQRWALYQAPTRDKYRLWIEALDGAGNWHILFRAGDPAHQEDADLIDYVRSRGAWDPVPELPMQYYLFADWMVRRVLARHPEYFVVRVKLERVQVTPVGIVPEGTFVETRSRGRNRVVP